MPEYVTPGVYVEEPPDGPRLIEGVATSTAAFLGEAERGPTSPQLVTSVVEYARWFGGALPTGRYLPAAVRGFFENGGRRLFVARIVGAGATTASTIVNGFSVQASGAGAWGNRVWLRVLASGGSADDSASSFRVRLAYWTEPNPPHFDPFESANASLRPRPQLQEEFGDLTIDPSAPNYFAKRIVSPLAALSRAGGLPWPASSPSPGDFLEGGGDASGFPTAADYAGAIDPSIGRGEPQGLAALAGDAYRDASLVYAPFPAGDPSSAIPKLIVQHCEAHRFRFGVIDSPNVDPMLLRPRETPGGIGDTAYASFYAPWIVVSDGSPAPPAIVPPGGYVLGIYARVDAARGVHKAPANVEVRGAVGLAFSLTDDMQSELNPRGVNVIRAFPSRGIRVWGARTLSADPMGKYVPMRRYFIFLERSIAEGTQWVAFEPNGERLWERVREVVRVFLRAQWRSGALVGRVEDEAFFVSCDRSTMTEDDILNGRLICEIGVAPVRPAEFVIFRIFQRTMEPA